MTREPARKPAAYRLDDDEPAAAKTTAKTKERKRAPSSYQVAIVGEAEDPFLNEDPEAIDADAVDSLTPEPAKTPERRWSFRKIALTAFGLLFSMALALWIDNLIRALFERAEWLGWVATGLTAIGLFSLAIIALREALAIARLNSVHRLRQEAEAARADPRPAKARAVLKGLINTFEKRPETARSRERLKELDDDIIDAPHLMELAESELLGPIDKEARAMILAASKRVSIVTAISPRALVDVGYVLFESIRLIRTLAYLYGARPGTLGLLRLSRDVVGHLAVTGSIAVGDSLVQQVVGHGVASRLSARLGEGVINGLLTARIGIAAMDLCRPMRFHAVKRPGIGDFLADLTRQAAGSRSTTDKQT